MQRFLVGLIAVVALGVVGLALIFMPERSLDPQGVKETYSGVFQRGSSLGSLDAPTTVTIFVDTQCPACARFDSEALPGIIDRHVRTGQARLVLRPIDFLGADSLRGAQAAYAAGDQNRMWQMATLLLQARSSRNSGYTSDAFLSSLAVKAGAAPGRLLADLPGRVPVVREATEEARREGVKGTPTFLVEGKGGSRRLVEFASPKASELSEAIEGR